MFIKELKTSFLMLVVLSALTGLVYPLSVLVVARVCFPRQAEGSLIEKDGKAVGSALIGQPFDDPKYFWGRISATTPAYNASASGGSNLGPTSPALLDEVNARVKALRAAETAAIEAGAKERKLTREEAEAAIKKAQDESIPVDLVTSSGSGLDPQISPAAALYQARRVSLVRGIPMDELKKLISAATIGRSLGLFGEPGVNVLRLNLALDHQGK